MRGKEIITKLIIPGAIAMIICLIVHPMCMNGEILDWRKLLLFVGIPFGIQKMFLLVVPRNVGTGEMLGLVVLKLMVMLPDCPELLQVVHVPATGCFHLAW